MICSSCGGANRDGAKFCAKCGHALGLACPSCGAAYEAGDVFCAECGTTLAAAAAAATAPPVQSQVPVAERRLVSVLFADLVGFTSISETRDAEEVRELLSRYFGTCSRLIGLYGGTVEKFIGDAVMAVWGAPTATEDDAERAVRAALDLVAAVSALGDEVGVPELRARAGVLTGEAAVTIGASGEGMVAGDLVNTASRVQSAADPGTVFVGDATRRATEQAIAYDDAGEFALKGKEALTPLWQALRVVSGVRGALKSQGLEAPFVGRERELRQIKDLFHVCAAEKKAHLVSMTGIAGIGKSRLGWEFYKYFDGIIKQVWWHRGRCLAYGEGVAYWALADMVRMRCRIAEDEPAESALLKLRATVHEQLLEESERRFVEPRLAQLLGLGEAETTDRQDLFAAWRLFFERLADSNPVVLVFEDLQWADASLLDFIEYLLEWSRNHPLLVLTLARPELHEQRPGWGAGQRNFTSIYLEPLSEQAMGALLAGLVPGLPDGLRSQILARAEGVPLYAVETVRMLLDRGALVQDGPVYRPTGEIDALEVPETLQALIAARLDGLSDTERQLLQDAAVLGKTFTQAALAALTGLDAAELEPLLSNLVRKEVLGLQADPRSPEHGQYGFLQDLVRRVAYDTLARRDRKQRHLAAADHLLSALGEDEAAEVVAAHLAAAFEAVPDAEDVGALKERAVAALVRAGERAASLAASAEAQRYYERASELTDDRRSRASFAARAGEMAYRASRPVEARALLEQAHAAFDELDDARAAARVSAVLADIDFEEGHPPRAVARLEPAFAALDTEEPDEVLAVVAAQLGRFLIFIGEADRAAPYLERALQLAEALDLPETFAQALNSKSLIIMNGGRPRETRILLEGALAVATENGLHAAALRAHNNLSVALLGADEWRENIANVERALELARRVGLRNWESNFLAGSIGALNVLGRWDEALAREAEAEELAATEFAQGLSLYAIPIHCNRGSLDRARELLRRHAGVRESENPDFAGGYLMMQSQLLLAEGDPKQALEISEQARAKMTQDAIAKWALFGSLEAAAAAGDEKALRELLAWIDALRAGELTPALRAYRARFRARLSEADANAEYTVAAEIFDELGAPFLLAIVQLEHSEHLAATGRSDAASELHGQAQTTFERLRATPWVERAARAGAGSRRLETSTLDG